MCIPLVYIYTIVFIFFLHLDSGPSSDAGSPWFGWRLIR